VRLSDAVVERLRRADAKKRPPGITRGRSPNSSSMAQPIRDTARKINEDRRVNARNNYILLTYQP
jgi:hypothetical protein